MSAENVEIVRRIYEAAGRRDRATVLAHYDTDVEWDSSGSPLTRLVGGQRIYRGHTGLQNWFREYHEAWERIDDDYTELIDAGDQVISVATARARGRTSGIEIEMSDYAALWTIRRGKIVRVMWFATREEARKAAGL